ncbi:FAD/NAD(P)-binding oxidoreductase family protein [Tanacetum coccineum]
MNTVVSRFIIHTHTPPYGRNFTGVHVHVAISSSTRHRRLRTVAYSETEEDGRVFPVSDNSSTIVDCLLNEARRRGVEHFISELVIKLHSLLNDVWIYDCKQGKSCNYQLLLSAMQSFIVKIEKRTIDYVDFIEADYLLMASGSSQQGIDEDILWASISNNSLMCIAALLKQCSFLVTGKGQFKDEFVTAGGVPLSEISLKTMESRIRPRLFFAGEVLNVDGITGGFNFQANGTISALQLLTEQGCVKLRCIKQSEFSSATIA